MKPEQQMVDAIRAILGLGPLYQPEEKSIAVRMTRALNAFTSGNTWRNGRTDSQKGKTPLP